MNRPDPRTFALYSYYLAIASGGLIVLAFIFSFIESVRFLTQMIWLTLITSGIGAFLAYAARSDFARMKQPPEESINHARIGWRNNLLTFGVVTLLALVVVILNVLFAAR